MTNIASTAKQPKSRAIATVSIAEAKANLSSIVTGVQQKHSPITILRRGVPVAQIVPVPNAPIPRLSGSMAGTGCVLGDIISPTEPEWTLQDWPTSDLNAHDED